MIFDRSIGIGPPLFETPFTNSWFSALLCRMFRRANTDHWMMTGERKKKWK